MIIPAPFRDVLFLDFETFSETDLKKCGLYRYAADPAARVLMLAHALNDEPARVWEPHKCEMPAQLQDQINDPTVLKVAHNAPFEMAIFDLVLDWPQNPAHWFCTMALAYSLALPGSLGEVGDVIGLPEDKKKLAYNRRLIRTFCVPQKPNANGKYVKARIRDWNTDPEDWAAFVSYCLQDVEAERAVYKKLVKWAPSEFERRVWTLDQKINQRGLPIDLDLVDSALDIDATNKAEALESAKEITELDNPNSRDQMLAWVRERVDFEVENLQKATVEKLLELQDLPGDVRAALEIRVETSKTSIKKFDALKRSAGDDGRVRGCFQYAGAGRTNRWGGRIFQPQNLPRGVLKDERQMSAAIGATKTRDPEFLSTLYDKPTAILSSLIRCSVAAKPGRVLNVADLSSIESVMLGWSANAESLLAPFRDGRDPYKFFYSGWMGVDYDAVTKTQRNFAKPPSLGCGYMLGGPGLVAYAAGMRVSMSLEQAQSAVDFFRSEFPEIVQFWWDCDSAMKEVIQYGGKAKVTHFQFIKDGPFLRLVLPSGRSIFYCRPKIEILPTPWGVDKPTVTYEGVNQYSRKWCRIKTHPGKVTENIVQAISRDILAEGLLNADAADFQIVGHVHDEIISEDDTNRVDELIEAMSAAPAWCHDAPIKAAGWAGQFYRKD